ncbi:MAG: DUF1624 domain-containing protein [Chitinophagaceae bacterium]|nr:DUF1624 domain-containing protein [Chitinophagaceae bacterium]
MPAEITSKQAFRIGSIDLLRGTVMIIMALDHVRDYFHADSFMYDPLDLEKTSPFLFFTRWITHFCAPVFVFLAGTSGFLSGQKKTKKELCWFLLTRGLWLIILECTVINFAWAFNISLPMIPLTVIWALGIGMVSLSVLIFLPRSLILVIGIILVGGHNLLDPIHVQEEGPKKFFWSLLHEPGMFVVGGKNIFVGYPVISWIGLMALGYSFGQLYTPRFDAQKRKRILIIMGVSAIFLFIILRSFNIYGDSAHWSKQSSPLFSFFSFIKTTKYPPSLLYMLMTIGPALLFLAFTERPLSRLGRIVSVYGRVPFFYYLLHIYIIHLLAMFAAEFSNKDWTDMIISFWVSFDPQLQGYGFDLWVTYAVWIVVVVGLYPLCKWYDRYKTNNRHKKWLSYL